MELTKAQMEANKTEFLGLIERIRSTRNASTDDWDGLIDFLNNSDFFVAPASGTFHNNYEGGLCEHCLNVYRSMVNMSNMHYTTTKNMPNYTWESLAVVSLFHDISKINQYEKQFKNVKEYWNGDESILSEYNKKDEGGYFRWTVKSSFGRKDMKESYTYGSHEESSVFVLQEYIKLDKAEIQAILHHSGQLSNDYGVGKDFNHCYSNNQLATMLHLADMYSAFVLESTADE